MPSQNSPRRGSSSSSATSAAASWAPTKSSVTRSAQSPMGATRRSTRWRTPSKPSLGRLCPRTSCASPTTRRAASSAPAAPSSASSTPSQSSSRTPSSASPRSSARSPAASWTRASRCRRTTRRRAVFALGPPRHLAQEACWLPPSGGGFGLLSRDGPACTRPLCVTAGVAAALRWRFKEADDSFSAARSSRACCCFRSPQWSRRLLPLSGSRRCFHLASQRFCPACHFLSVS
mmetsp:Transcript_21983/g.71777  ORF Transcript_21983/g.71777 Transcript_21983/m.71777 type:complete len:233 (+) Transcript_21983:555-1253(+)